MSRQTRGHAAIARLTSALTAEYVPEVLLQDICDQAVSSLDVNLATLVVVHQNDTLLLSSSPVVLDEQSQQLHNTGPADESARRGAVSIADDVRVDQGRWAAAAELMAPLGLIGARSFPLRLAGAPIGSLTLYTGDLWGADRSSMVAQTLADLAVLALTQDQTGDGRELSLARLINYLVQERAAIYQAQGMVAEAMALTIAAAADRLSEHAKLTGSTVGVVAGQIVGGQLQAGSLSSG